MKKVIIFLLASVAMLGLMSFTNPLYANSESLSSFLHDFPEMVNDVTADASSSRTITVYKITIVGANGAAAKQSFSAEFDEEKMELCVVERRNGRTLTFTYSVYANPYKGYSDDPRGSYTYHAGDYYFN